MWFYEFFSSFLSFSVLASVSLLCCRQKKNLFSLVIRNEISKCGSFTCPLAYSRVDLNCRSLEYRIPPCTSSTWCVSSRWRAYHSNPVLWSVSCGMVPASTPLTALSATVSIAATPVKMVGTHLASRDFFRIS